MKAFPDFDRLSVRERTRSVSGHGHPDHNLIVYTCGCSESWYGLFEDLEVARGVCAPYRYRRDICMYHLNLIRKEALAKSFLECAADIGATLAHKVLNGDTKMAEVDRDIASNRAFVENVLQADYDAFYRNAWTAFCERFDEGYTLPEDDDDQS